MIETFRLAACGTRREIEFAARGARHEEAALLHAVLAQYDGDVDKAVRLLRRQIDASKGADRAPFVDMLAPISAMRHEYDNLERLSEMLADAGWSASAHAFRALTEVGRGRRASALRQVGLAEKALGEETDDVTRFRVMQRLARATFYLHEYDRALDFALRSARLCAAHRAWRAAGAGYSIAHSVHHSATGDIAEASRFAALWLEAAEKSEDESFMQAALAAAFEIAVQMADDGRIEDLKSRIHARLMPQQYAERFVIAFSSALCRGWVDLQSMRAILSVLRDAPDVSRGEWALCTALVALAEVVDADDSAARASISAALTRLGRPRSGDSAYELRHRRLARAVISASCLLLGDEVRAQRIVAVRESLEGLGEHELPGRMAQGSLQCVAPALRGIARILAFASERKRANAAPAGLTAAEYEVLRLLGTGRSAGEIASETNRSRHTVYHHTRAIIAKLGVRRAPEAVASARARGLI